MVAIHSDPPWSFHAGVSVVGIQDSWGLACHHDNHRHRGSGILVPVRAIEDYDEAIRLNPQYADAYNTRGDAYRRDGQYERAIQDYDEAIRLNPRFIEAITSLGQLRMAEGKTAEAEARFRSALQINPRFTPARVNLERLLRQK